MVGTNKTQQRRECAVSVRFTTDEMEGLKRAAGDRGLSKAAHLRMLFLQSEAPPSPANDARAPSSDTPADAA